MASGFDQVVWLHEMLIRQADPAASSAALHPGRLKPAKRWQPRVSVIVPYRTADPAQLGLSGFQDFADIPDAALTAAIEQVVANEGPVHFNVVASRLLEAAGIKRLGRRIRARIKAQLQAMDKFNFDGDWVAQAEQMLVPPYRDWRTAPNKTRQLEHVSDAELMLALFRAVFDDRLTDEDSIMNTGLHNMGFIRFTERARSQLQNPLSRLYELEMLMIENGNVAVGKKAFLR